MGFFIKNIFAIMERKENFKFFFFIAIFLEWIANNKLNYRSDFIMSKNKINRTGEINVSNQGCIMKIIEYNDALDVIIEFQGEHRYRMHTQYGHFKKGNCKNPFYPSVFGHGYLGVDRNNKVPKISEFKNGRWCDTWE